VLLLSILVLRYEWPLPPGAEPILTAGVDAANPAEVALPDDWRQRQYRERVETYTLRLSLQALPTAPLGLMLPAVRMNAAWH